MDDLCIWSLWSRLGKDKVVILGKEGKRLD